MRLVFVITELSHRFILQRQSNASFLICTMLSQTFVVLFSLDYANLSRVNVDARISMRIARAYWLHLVFLTDNRKFLYSSYAKKILKYVSTSTPFIIQCFIARLRAFAEFKFLCNLLSQEENVYF